MKLLVGTLWVKIVVTILVWAGPLLVLSESTFKALGIPALRTPFFGRLLGVAMAALVVMYIFGLVQAYRGEVPWGTIAAGVVSNGGAAALIGATSLSGGFYDNGWNRRGELLIEVSGLLAFGIFTALVVSAVRLAPLRRRRKPVSLSGRLG